MKKLLLLTTCVALSACLLAQVAGPKSATSFNNRTLDGSRQSWTNVNNAGSSDNVYAATGDISGTSGSYTDYLEARNYGFNIPANATITGIAIGVERSDPNTSTSDYSIRLVKGGTVTGTDHSTGAMYSSTENFEIMDIVRTFGGDGDLWNETWTPADINSSNFGAVVSAQRAVDGTVTNGRVDNISITVYYSINVTLPIKLTSFNATPKNDMVRLNWVTSEETNMDRFEVQRSANGTEFSSFGTVICKNHILATAYSFNDYSPIQGSSFYRLKIFENTGNISYSKVVAIQAHTEPALVALYPSPWKKGESLFIKNANNEKLTIHFYTNTGELTAKVTTSSNVVPTEGIAGEKGLLRYQVFNTNNKVVGSGTLMSY
jgi:hypothetical protein